MLSVDLIKRMMVALTSQSAGAELADAVNASMVPIGGAVIAAMIVATSTSPTVDFGSAQVGDTVIHFIGASGLVSVGKITVAGALNQPSATVGDTYLLVRNSMLPMASMSATKITL